MKIYTKIMRIRMIWIISLTAFLSISIGCVGKDSNIKTVEALEQKLFSDNSIAEETDTSVSSITEADVLNLMKFWENAQDTNDFEDYRNCYTKPFKGVKTVSKTSREYDYAEWMNDRRKMLEKAVGLDIEVKNLRISISGETATVEFDQYYRSKNYSDWGPKVLRMKQTPDGLKIAYEILRESYPL